MNTLYQDFYTQAKHWYNLDNEGEWENLEHCYAEIIIKECVNQISDYLDKQRVLKHFGMIE